MLLWTIYDGELYLENWPLKCEEEDCDESQTNFKNQVHLETTRWEM